MSLNLQSWILTLISIGGLVLVYFKDKRYTPWWLIWSLMIVVALCWSAFSFFAHLGGFYWASVVFIAFMILNFFVEWHKARAKKKEQKAVNERLNAEFPDAEEFQTVFIDPTTGEASMVDLSDPRVNPSTRDIQERMNKMFPPDQNRVEY